MHRIRVASYAVWANVEYLIQWRFLANRVLKLYLMNQTPLPLIGVVTKFRNRVIVVSVSAS